MGRLSDPRFLKRLRLYIYGVLFGILMVVFLFPKRCGFPDVPSREEVRGSFRKDSLLLSDRVETRLDSLEMDTARFRSLLLDGEFLLPKRKDRDRKSFQILTEEEPKMKVFLQVLDDGGTRADSILFQD